MTLMKRIKEAKSAAFKEAKEAAKVVRGNGWAIAYFHKGGVKEWHADFCGKPTLALIKANIGGLPADVEDVWIEGRYDAGDNFGALENGCPEMDFYVMHWDVDLTPEDMEVLTK